ncbi:penicillin acylase family protein [Burkholderia glumae]|uniref:penicillin acylase family protein n=1 Tax=Burkholderia glumae TaxID=337 RepID=UPI000C27E1B7|nr:penicillin acylase family protein [Burkholderia glumae]MCM2495832.1 penicillin acylase family protein [Burkholderia glumae]MCM2546792.1 penicillin acylase family protein [Burkholderia glumae]PJO22695.1 acylase [Burkholderia glumae AU6208]QHE13148.1 penicillin acylase family protein [Burkholderia glumae AU6208]
MVFAAWRKGYGAAGRIGRRCSAWAGRLALVASVAGAAGSAGCSAPRETGADAATQAAARPTAGGPAKPAAASEVAAGVAAPAGAADIAAAASGLAATVVIRRTTDGIPHIEAANWQALGYGYGYAQASDNLCTMAEAFVTYRGERARFFGAGGKPAARSTFGTPTNLDSDFFFRLVAPPATLARYRRSQPPELRQLISGFAAGYDRYLAELRAGGAPGRHAACRAAPWLAAITADDVVRRLYAANLAGGAARFVAALANARPPAEAARHAGLAARGAAAAAASGLTAAGGLAGLDAEAMQVGGHYGIGSNGIAFGRDATHGEPILLGNPHWFWSGPDRFYQAQLTIPGRLNVSGASFLGVPVIMIGYNDAVAWTHTVSGARRFGLFQLTLAADDPTVYRVDGRRIAMTPVVLTVPVRRPDGTLASVTRTLYRSRYGPLVDLSSWSPALAWTRRQAFALRDVNADNDAIFATFLAFGRARSLDAFIAAQRAATAMPWVNTLAIGRGDPRVWYADIGNVPDVPDALADRCTPPLGRAFDARLPGVPFLDGARAACDWRRDSSAARPGSLPASAMPGLLRRDFVANMNNSYWLANPAAPLTGFARVTGIGAAPLDLRAQLGLRFAMRAAAAAAAPHAGNPANPAAVTTAEVERFSLAGETLSATRYRPALLDRVCANPIIMVGHDPLSGAAYRPARRAPTAAACATLRAWHGAADPEARGVLLWDQFWARVAKLAPARLYTQPFDAADPLHTPAGLRADDPAIAEAFGAAILAVTDAGFALDARRGETLYLTRNGESIPLYGGCANLGYFTAVCDYGKPRARQPITADTLAGNSYLQVVTFDARGPEAHTLLAHSESDDPASPHYADGTRRYAARRWLRTPFEARAIAADPGLDVTRLTLPAALAEGPHPPDAADAASTAGAARP